MAVAQARAPRMTPYFNLVNVTLASSVTALMAVQVSLPIELTALAMVGLVLRWMLRKDAASDHSQEERLAHLEKQVEANRRQIDLQRHRAHAALNRVASVKGTLLVMRQAASRCSCGELAVVAPLVDEVIGQLDVTDLAYQPEEGT